MVIIIVALIILLLLIWGHYGIPEKQVEYFPDPDTGDIIAGAEPFEFVGKNNEVGILLVHGFEGSPYTMKDLGVFLNRRGYHVYSPLLPGHGTSIRIFSRSRYRHWYKKVADIYGENRNKFKHFFVIGLSMGGSLTLDLLERTAQEKEKQPSGAIVLAAPVFFNGYYNGKLILKDWRLLFTGFAKIFLTYLKKPTRNPEADLVSPWKGYQDYLTIPCLHSLKRNLSRIRSRLWRINVPMLLIHAVNDKTVDVENQAYIFNHIRSRERVAYGFTLNDPYSSNHILTTHQESRARAFHYIDTFIQDAMKDFHRNLPKEKPNIWDKLKMWWGD